MDEINFLAQLADPESVRREAARRGVQILGERPHEYLDGTCKIQFAVRDSRSGVGGFLVPASDAAMRRQRDAGRFLAPFNFVRNDAIYRSGP